MLGYWNSKTETSSTKWKVTFHILEADSKLKMNVILEPLPLRLEVSQMTVNGSKLHAKAALTMIPGAEATIELAFQDNAFTGFIELPFIGRMELNGEQGKGRSLAEDLIEKVAPYYKTGVIRRSPEQIEQEVEQLLARMTIEEKIGQMSQCQASHFSFGGDVKAEPAEVLVKQGRAGSILGAFDSGRIFELQKLAVEQSRLGIPLFFNADVIHGFQTIFPVPLAWSCSWDLEGIRQACEIAAKEAAATGITYNHGPMIDVTRDARWGRVVEGAGEDPYLASLIAEAQVKGFQGDDLFGEENIIACLKHFIAYGAAEAGRDYNTVDMSEWMLRNVYLPPFEAGIKAGAASVMNAFNIYQGIPVAGHRYLLQDVLRKELGFEGILISDYGSIDEIYIHGAAKDPKDAAMKSLHASMDIEMVTQTYETYLPELLKEGKIQIEQLDEAVRRILTLKYAIGIMDDPFRYIRPEREMELHFNPAHLQNSLELARKSIVLLKNEAQTLPLRKNNNSNIALIGPFANSKDLLGPWQFSRYGEDTITLLEGLKNKGLAPENILWCEGSKVNEPIEGGIEAAIAAAEQAEVVVLALGESSHMSGEAASRMDIQIPEPQRKLAEALVQTGKPIVLVLTNGRPLELEWFDQHMHAIVETWFLGSMAGEAIADVLMGDYNPTGRLTMSFPRKVGQVPIYYNHFYTGRPVTAANQHEKYISKYLDGPNSPLYPFGFGLSYTHFDYTDLSLDQTVLRRDGSIKVTVTVANQGPAAGEETVQLYVRDLYGSTVRPVLELKGFQKIALQVGQSKRITFEITEQHLKYVTSDLTCMAEEGEFEVLIGAHSGSLTSQTFELV